MKLLIVLVVAIALTSALPTTKPLNWQAPEKTQSESQAFGGGSFHHRDGGGVAGFVNPNGSGGQVKYGHESGYGQSFGADGRVPIYSNKNRFGESTINLGAGADYHKGGGGFGDKRIGLSFHQGF